MSALDDARNALHTFAKSQGWYINSRINSAGIILATIDLQESGYICNTCKQPIIGPWASLGGNMVLCIPCYDKQEEG